MSIARHEKDKVYDNENQKTFLIEYENTLKDKYA